MPDKNLQFLDIPRAEPAKIPVEARVTHFREIYAPYQAEEAAQQLDADGVSVEILDLRTVMPWDKAAVLESARKTSKVLVLHEDTRTGGFGGEIAATIAEEAFEDLDAPVRRLTAPDSPVPFSPALEKAFIPQVDDVVRALKELIEY